MREVFWEQEAQEPFEMKDISRILPCHLSPDMKNPALGPEPAGGIIIPGITAVSEALTRDPRLQP